MSSSESDAAGTKEEDDGGGSTTQPEPLDCPRKRKIFPSSHPFEIRCFTCGAVVSLYWLAYQRELERGRRAHDILDDFGIREDHCRRMFLTHRDMVATRMAKGQIYT